ncbi:MAG: DSD1 family PLP-dependent enzyme [Geminicoccaceae bacterium]|nr:DSD1 family PLP-dependent enzyme [Geminicoccaceae bacterium]
MSRERDAWDRALIGEPGGREKIETPALILDLDAFERNLHKMAEIAAARKIALRPHAKTHKCSTIGRLQMQAGAIGLCCAKLGEAEVMARALGGDGVPLLLASPQIGSGKIGRLLALNERTDDLMVVLDDAANAHELAAATAGRKPLQVLIDCDVGTHRFGVTSAEQALELARIAEGCDTLRLMGVQGYAGHCQAIVDHEERRRATTLAIGILADVRDALRDAGHACPIVTGSGTGTHDADSKLGVLTDLQVGSYIFSDVVYDGIEMAADEPRRFERALFVQTRVVSARQRAYVTTDAGSKSFSMDGPPPMIVAGAPAGSTYGRFGDEFGRVELPDGATPPPIGTLVTCLVPHCDPTLNLFDAFHCVRGGTLVDIWPIDARGESG